MPAELCLRGGVRYEHFSLSVEDFNRPAAYTGVAARTAAGFQPFVLPALRVRGGDFRYDAVTGNAGATFRLAERTELYGGFSQGFALPDVGPFTRRAGLSTAFACPVARPNCLPAGFRRVSRRESMTSRVRTVIKPPSKSFPVQIPADEHNLTRSPRLPLADPLQLVHVPDGLQYKRRAISTFSRRDALVFSTRRTWASGFWAR